MARISQIVPDIVNSKPVVTHIARRVDNAKYLTGALVGGNILKDVFAYSLRVKEDVENTKMPKDKKHFVTVMDATSGIATVLLQVGTAFAIGNSKVQGALCNKIFKPLKNNSQAFKKASNAFGLLSTLTAATIIAKRIFLPLVATPIATKISESHKQKAQ